MSDQSKWLREQAHAYNLSMAIYKNKLLDCSNEMDRLERDRARLIETLSDLVSAVSWYEERKQNLGAPVICHGDKEIWANVLTRDLAPARALLKELK